MSQSEDVQFRQVLLSIKSGSICEYIFVVYGEAEKKCAEYASAKGPGTTARPGNHLFFRKFGPVIKRTLEKCDRENGMM